MNYPKSKKPLTVGELKAALQNIPDDVVVCVVASDWDSEEVDCIAGDLRDVHLVEDEDGRWLQLDGWEEGQEEDAEDDGEDEGSPDDPPMTGGKPN